MANKINKILINNIASSNFVPNKLRIKIYNFCGMNVQAKAFWPGSNFSGVNLKVGKGTWINSKCTFDNDIASITIGKNCGIGMEVLFCTSSHEIGDEDKRGGENIKLPIVVGDGCWIGARTTILPGIEIGKGCVIAAGAVVTKNCEPNGLYVGTPARRIKELNDEKKIGGIKFGTER
ncbi:acyltransferase [Priestia megaterium]|uniref:acyltransferase n=1 Tax=Priestia megaterium TaxID=1404 RepID=UPI0005C61CCE|nr:acyltransferase [Priestia megaterium]